MTLAKIYQNRGKFAFLVTSDSNAPFQIWNVGSNQNNILAIDNTCANWIDLSKSTAMAYMNDLIFIVNENQAALNIINNENICPNPTK
jgi:hypothetical protein